MTPLDRRASAPAEPPGSGSGAGGNASIGLGLEFIEGLKEKVAALRREIARAIVGQDAVVDEILIALLAGGHALLEGVPGLAKTLLVGTLARATSLEFRRIQFTPDLMPSDITGTQVIQPVDGGRREPVFVPGPVFAGVVLADEINRSPPKTQAALLEAMAERQVTAGGRRHRLPEPFFVLATQNPIEQEGTYPLPEAQRDRFLLHIIVDYPSAEEERGILLRTTGTSAADARPVIGAGEIVLLQKMVRAMPLAEPLVRHAADIVRRTRPSGRSAPEEVRRWAAWGAGPRATQAIILAAKARTFLDGRFAVTRSDLRAMALPALRHRVIPNFRAEGEGIGPEDLVRAVLAATPAAAVREKAIPDARTRQLLRF